MNYDISKELAEQIIQNPKLNRDGIRMSFNKEKIMPQLLTMERRGGSFASTLALAWYHADGLNHTRLCSLFNDLVAQYEVTLPDGHIVTAQEREQAENMYKEGLTDKEIPDGN